MGVQSPRTGLPAPPTALNILCMANTIGPLEKASPYLCLLSIKQAQARSNARKTCALNHPDLGAAAGSASREHVVHRRCG